LITKELEVAQESEDRMDISKNNLNNNIKILRININQPKEKHLLEEAHLQISQSKVVELK